MPHPDQERLVLLALGEQTDSWADDTLHVAGCRPCRDEMRSLRAVATIAADALREQPLTPVSAAVWDRVAAEALAPRTPAWGVEPAAHAPSPRRGRGRARRAAMAVGAAVAGAAAAVIVVATTAPADTVVARVDLVAQDVPASNASGTVTFLDRGRGRLVARIAMSGVPSTTGLYEVWLFDGHTTMIPLGVTNGAPVDLPVPTSLSLSAFPVVDVSAQRLGQQEHGVSVLRGVIG